MMMMMMMKEYGNHAFGAHVAKTPRPSTTDTPVLTTAESAGQIHGAEDCERTPFFHRVIGIFQ
jgi:hypothetical protein